MLYSAQDVFEYVEQEDVKFIRLAFCDVTGRQKNISIMPEELKRAFSYGISFDASAIAGFGGPVGSDLFLHPIPSTLNVLPWRPSRGKVVKMFCSITHPDGTPFAMDSRAILERAVNDAKALGCKVSFGSEFEFYLFKTDETGQPTAEPFDHAGYMDVAPEDKGEDVRREICLNLQDMGIQPESSHHEEGPGQNEIDFRYSDAMSAADNAMHFKTVVKTAALRNGLYADFSPKPLAGEAGNGMHINMSVKCQDGADVSEAFLAGVLAHVREITAFLNPVEGSYRRLELRSPDPMANPYLAYALLIHAGLDGIRRNLSAPLPVNENLYTAPESLTSTLEQLPGSLAEAKELARGSAFVASILPAGMLD